MSQVELTYKSLPEVEALVPEDDFREQLAKRGDLRQGVYDFNQPN